MANHTRTIRPFSIGTWTASGTKWSTIECLRRNLSIGHDHESIYICRRRRDPEPKQQYCQHEDRKNTTQFSRWLL